MGPYRRDIGKHGRRQAARRLILPMTRRILRVIGLLAALCATGALAQGRAQTSAPARDALTIPFEPSIRHILVKATVNHSRPLSFVLDTGASVALVRTDVARELGLQLGAPVKVGGAGPGTQSGYFVSGATWSLVGLEDLALPVNMALPLPELPRALGRPVDGIIGGQFIRQFVVELDYQARLMTLHDPATFTYTGPGESIPIEFVSGSQPTISATVTATGGQPLTGRFLFDVGSGQALILHSPFVTQHQLLRDDSHTIRPIGGAGAGGPPEGRLGRTESLRIGSFTLNRPITMFSKDKAGAFANAALAGNIGAQVAMRFRLFLDYRNRCIIFEPAATYGEPFDRAFSGVALRAYGDDYRTFRVIDVLERSPASAAGIKKDDVIMAIDGVPADQLRLWMINDMFERPNAYTVTILRGNRTLTVNLTPAKLI